MKLHTALSPENIGPSAKLHSTTMVTLTRLLIMRIVASSLSGTRNRRITRSPEEDSSSSSHCTGVSEKNEISLPETNPEMTRAIIASESDTIWAVDMAGMLSRGLLMMSSRKLATCSVAGKGSESKTKNISYTKSSGISAPSVLSLQR